MNMQSLILRTAGHFLLPLLLLFSLFLLLRGHNEPGGGFIAGLLAAAAVSLHLFAVDAAAARRILPAAPRDLIGWGLTLSVLSALPSIFFGKPFFTSIWFELPLPVLGTLKLGTPLFFDVGVYMVVVGSVLTIVLNLAEGR